MSENFTPNSFTPNNVWGRGQSFKFHTKSYRERHGVEFIAPSPSSTLYLKA